MAKIAGRKNRTAQDVQLLKKKITYLRDDVGLTFDLIGVRLDCDSSYARELYHGTKGKILPLEAKNGGTKT